MLTTLSTIWRAAQSKAVILGLSLLALLTVLAKVFATGKASAKLDQAQATIKEQKKNAEIAATIDSLSAAERRKRLLNDWSDR